MPPPMVLVPTENGRLGRGRLWCTFQGLSQGDPGGTATYHYLQRGCRCGPLTLGHHGGSNEGGGDPRRG